MLVSFKYFSGDAPTRVLTLLSVVGGSFPLTQCLLCLGKAHFKEQHLICKSFMKRFQVTRDLCLKQHLLELAMLSASALRSTLDRRLPSHSQSADISNPSASASLKRLRSRCQSSVPRTMLHKTDRGHSRSCRDLSASSRKIMDRHGVNISAQDGVGPINHYRSGKSETSYC